MAETKFLTESGIKKLVKILMEEIDNQLGDQIVTLIADTSTDAKAPSAKAVYDFVLAQIADVAHFKFEVIGWGNSLPATGEAHIVYLNQAAENGYWVMWYYFNGAWVELGTTAIDLIDYWKKDELVPLTDGEIQAIFDEVLAK